MIAIFWASDIIPFFFQYSRKKIFSEFCQPKYIAFELYYIVDENVDSKFDWVCKVGERVLRDNKNKVVSAGSLHLLYLSVCSGNVDALKSVITFLEKHKVLGNELKHFLPNASILDVALRGLDEQEDELAYNRPPSFSSII